MKIGISAVSNWGRNEIIVEGELLQVVEDLRQGKIDISNIINKYISWLYDKETDTISNPKCFIVDYDSIDYDVDIELYDYYDD